jgi:hypothetical protein
MFQLVGVAVDTTFNIIPLNKSTGVRFEGIGNRGCRLMWSVHKSTGVRFEGIGNHGLRLTWSVHLPESVHIPSEAPDVFINYITC